MRIKKLHLPAYGCFTDYKVEFADDKSFFLLYGPNEAGKTTLLNSMLDLFYDINKDTAYAYKHGTPAIAATVILSDGQSITFEKRKGSRKMHLLTSEDNTDEIQNLRNLLDRETFAGLFGMDHQTLRSGGEALARGEGKLAESIFMAASGLNNLHTLLQKLGEHADKLYRPRGRKNQIINFLINQYRSKKNEIREAANKIEDFELIKEEYQDLKQELEANRSLLNQYRLEKIRKERILELLPKMKQYQIKAEERSKIGLISYLNPTAREDRIKAESALKSGLRQLEDIKRDIKKTNLKIKSFNIPPKLLELGDIITELQQDLGKYRSDLKNLPALEAELNSIVRQAREKLKMIAPELEDLEGADKYLLPLDVQLKIKKMLKSREELLQKRELIQHNIDDLQQQINDKIIQIQKLPKIIDTNRLQMLIEQISGFGNIDKAWKEQSSDLHEAKEKVNSLFASLPLYNGNLDSMSRSKLPLPETIDQWENKLNALEKQLIELTDEVKRITQYIEEIRGQLKNGLGIESFYSEEDLRGARSKRQTGWGLVKKLLHDKRDIFEEQEFTGGIPLVEAYEAWVKSADKIADDMREQAVILAQNQALKRELNNSLARLEAVSKQLTQKQIEFETAENEWQQEWAELGLQRVLSPREMRHWLQRAQEVKQEQMKVEQKQAALEALNHEIQEIKASFSSCISDMGLPPLQSTNSISMLVMEARKIVNDYNQKQQELESLLKIKDELEDNLRKYTSQQIENNKMLKDWETDWETIGARLGESKTLTPDIAADYLALNAELSRILADKNNCQERIDQAQAYVKQYEYQVEQLAEIIDPNLLQIQKDQALQRMFQNYSKACSDFKAMEEAKERIQARLNDYRRVLSEIKESKSILEELKNNAGCNTIQELEEAEELSARARQLDQEIEALKQEMLEKLPASITTLEELFAEMQTADFNEIEVEIMDLEGKIQELENKISDYTKAYGAKEHQYKKMLQDTSVRAAECAQEAENILSQIQNKSEEYIKYYLAYKVLSKSIQLYNEKNQAFIVKRAGELFAELTLGSFSGISIVHEHSQQIMVGVRPSGEEIKLEAMSDGTLDQLYLALRLANIEQYLLNNKALPLIMDDLLINFDEQRSAAILRVLKNIARQTQVIFFTHHQFLKELAVRELGGCIQVQDLMGMPHKEH